MKKRVIAAIIIFIIIIGVPLIINNIPKEYKGDTAEGIYMLINEESLTPTSATILISDLSGKKNSYGNEFTIYKKEKGKWLTFAKGNADWELNLHYVDENNELEMDLNWENIYGNLEAGEYKLVKYATIEEKDESYTFSTDFIIN